MDSKKFGMRYWWILLAFSVVSSVTGLVLIISPLKTAAAVITLTGITLLIAGADKIFVSIYTIVTKKGDSENVPVDLSDFRDYTERTE